MPSFICSLRYAAGLAAFALLPVPSAAFTRFLTNDTTFNKAIVQDDLVAGYANFGDRDAKTNGTSPTINFTSTSLNGNMFTYNSSIINFRSGGINVGDFVELFDDSAINISGGNIYANLDAFDRSKINVSGGLIYNGIVGVDDNMITVTGGNITSYGVSLYKNSVANISGGAIGGIGETDHGVANISGGSISSAITLYADSAVNLFGTGLNASIIPSTLNGFSEYLLAGQLNDGNSVNSLPLYVQNGVGAKVTFNGQTVITSAVPEPGSAALFVSMAVLGVGVLRKRRK